MKTTLIEKENSSQDNEDESADESLEYNRNLHPPNSKNIGRASNRNVIRTRSGTK